MGHLKRHTFMTQRNFAQKISSSKRIKTPEHFEYIIQSLLIFLLNNLTCSVNKSRSVCLHENMATQNKHVNRKKVPSATSES